MMGTVLYAVQVLANIVQTVIASVVGTWWFEDDAANPPIRAVAIIDQVSAAIVKQCSIHWQQSML